MRYALLGLLTLLSLNQPASTSAATPLVTRHALASESDSEIKRRIIQESINSYPGPCACPYQRTRNGSSCGRRSAYSKAGGYGPLCYPSDVTIEMVEAYRAQH